MAAWDYLELNKWLNPNQKVHNTKPKMETTSQKFGTKRNYKSVDVGMLNKNSGKIESNYHWKQLRINPLHPHQNSSVQTNKHISPVPWNT